jgi:hypothetical protein
MIFNKYLNIDLIKISIQIEKDHLMFNNMKLINNMQLIVHMFTEEKSMDIIHLSFPVSVR